MGRTTMTDAESERVPCATPTRRAGSVRRTSSMEMSWPEGISGPVTIAGRGRDLLTLDDSGNSRTISEDRLSVQIAPDHMIQRIETTPPLEGLSQLVGLSALKGFRRACAPWIENPSVAARPLALLLDDIVGCNVITGWIQVKWGTAPPAANKVDGSAQENICIGFATGSTALLDRSETDRSRYVVPLQSSEDPDAFHPLAPDADRQLRRVRRIDVWWEDGQVAIDAMFQDSGVVPGTRRAALHEYRLHARANSGADGLTLSSIEPIPGILPYTECLGAPASVQRLAGTKLNALRTKVLTEFRGPIGCTHLNDAVRSLAEVPLLATLGLQPA